jgi:hypothetical protein
VVEVELIALLEKLEVQVVVEVVVIVQAYPEEQETLLQ